MAHGWWLNGAMAFTLSGCWFKNCVAHVGVGMLRGKDFFGFLVPWLQSFLVSCFLSFKVSWFQRCFVSKFQRFTTFPFHVFRKILIPYPRFPRFHSTVRRQFSVPAFSKVVNILDFQNFEIYDVLLKYLGLSWIISGILGPPTTRIIGFGGQGRVRKCWNHRNEGLWLP